MATATLQGTKEVETSIMMKDPQSGEGKGDAAMILEPAASSTASSTAAAAAPTAASTAQSTLAIAEGKLNKALALYDDNKVSLAQASVKAIKKILMKIQKKPKDVRARRLLMKNIITQKFIIKVKGGAELAEAVGFRETEVGEKKTSYLVMENVDIPVVEKCIEMLAAKEAALKAAKSAPPKKAVRVQCPCGFWGSSDTQGLCSVCYRKKFVGAAPAKKEEKPKVKKVDTTWWKKLQRGMVVIRAMRQFLRGVKKKVQKNRQRCFVCRKKLGVTLGFECRCGYVFCGQHRLPDSHNCTFDHKQFHRNRLAKKGGTDVISSEKFERL